MESIFARQLADAADNNWYQLMQTAQPEHIARVISLAEQQLDLEAIASGPGMAMGLGLEYQQHQALDFVLQDLKNSQEWAGHCWRWGYVVRGSVTGLWR